MLQKLTDMGYVREDMVEGKGQFSVRGGILDIFPPAAENPYRIELFGDEVDSVRTFDVFTQVSVENADGVKIGPADESFRHKNSETCILEYFDDHAIVFFDEETEIAERVDGLNWDIEETVKALAEKDDGFVFQEKYIHNYFDVLRELLRHPFLSLSELPHQSKQFKLSAEFHVNAGDVGKAHANRDEFYDEIREWLKDYTVIFSVDKEKRPRLVSDLEEAGFTVTDAENGRFARVEST